MQLQTAGPGCKCWCLSHANNGIVSSSSQELEMVLCDVGAELAGLRSCYHLVFAFYWHEVGHFDRSFLGLQPGQIWAMIQASPYLSALFVWISSTIAIHVLHNKDKWKCSSLGGPLLATFWLALGIGGMHYLGLAAERGQFIARFDPWMIVLHVPILITCSFLMILVIVHFPSFTLSRCAGSVLLASLVGIVHYFGMVPVSHWSHPKGWTWQILPLKHINVEAEVSIIVSLFCDFLLMASNALLVSSQNHSHLL